MRRMEAVIISSKCPRSAIPSARSIAPTLLAAGDRRRRTRHQTARQSRPSGHARISVRQSRAVSRARVFARPPALSAAAHRRQGRRPFRADHLGRGARQIAERLASVAREYGPEAILPYSYAGTMGLLNGSGMDRRFFHRLGASRLDRTICSAAGMAGMTRRSASVRHRARTVPPLEADHCLGREYSRHQRPPVAVHRGGTAQRREVLHDRSATNRTGTAGGPALLHQSGQRPGARAGP